MASPFPVDPCAPAVPLATPPAERCKSRDGLFGPRCDLVLGHTGAHEHVVSSYQYRSILPIFDRTETIKRTWLNFDGTAR